MTLSMERIEKLFKEFEAEERGHKIISPGTIKLFNHTKLDDKILRKFIVEVSKSIGTCPLLKDVFVRVTTSGRWFSGACGSPTKGGRFIKKELKSLTSRQGYTPKKEFGKYVKARNVIYLSIPVFVDTDSFVLIKTFWGVVAHEWAHARDNQNGMRSHYKDIPYWYRYSEIRARKGSELAMKKLYERKESFNAFLALVMNLRNIRVKNKT